MEKIIFFSYLVLIPALHANLLEKDEYWKEHRPEFDAYWKGRANEAEKFNREAYDPNPFEVSSTFTSGVAE